MGNHISIHLSLSVVIISPHALMKKFHFESSFLERGGGPHLFDRGPYLRGGIFKRLSYLNYGMIYPSACETFLHSIY